MQKLILALFAIIAAVSAFKPTARRSVSNQLMMKNDFQKFMGAAVVGSALFLGGSARAEIDYDGIKYLGGNEKIDLNNANIRAYLKIPGAYPGLAAKIVTYGPFKSVSDVYSMPGLTGPEKDILKKNEARFVALDVKPEYDIDKIIKASYLTRLGRVSALTPASHTLIVPADEPE